MSERETVSEEEVIEILRRIAERRGRVALTVTDVASAANLPEDEVRAILRDIRRPQNSASPHESVRIRSSFDAAQARAEAWQAREATVNEEAETPDRPPRANYILYIAIVSLLALLALGWMSCQSGRPATPATLNAR